jgi:hypothetical protein
MSQTARPLVLYSVISASPQHGSGRLKLTGCKPVGLNPVRRTKASLFGEPCLIARLNPVTFVTCIYRQRIYAVIIVPTLTFLNALSLGLGLF